MAALQVRRALLDDTQAVSALFRSRIPVWQRINEDGQVENVPYEALSIYARWQHGGPWMSVETGALQLSHLLQGAGLPVVVTSGDDVVGYAEAYLSYEAAPFGDNLNLATIIARDNDVEVRDRLLNYLLGQANAAKCQRLTVSCVVNDADSIAFYSGRGLKPMARNQRLSLMAKIGQTFYRAVEHLDADAKQIQGGVMSVGRETSARHQWESLFPRTWDALPEMRRQRTHRLHITTAGQEAFVCVRQQVYNPRAADVYCWSQKSLTNSLLTAIRDWSHREGYRTLVMSVGEATAKLLGAEAESDGYYQEIYSIDV